MAGGGEDSSPSDQVGQEEKLNEITQLVVQSFSSLYSNKVGYSTSTSKSDTVFSSFPSMLGNARRMIGLLGEVVVEGELLARELLTLHPLLDENKGRDFWSFLWDVARGGRLHVEHFINHMFLSRSKGDQRAGDLKDKFEAVFGEAITNFE